MFDAVFETKVRDLWALYSATGDLQHKGEQGLFREIFVRRLLESLLPIQFGVGSGVIVDRWNRQSPQADLVIFDRRLMPPILQSDGHGVYVLDSVLRVIEVKSTLKKGDLLQFGRMVHAIDPTNADGLKLIEPGALDKGHAFYPFASVFAYRSSISKIQESADMIDHLNGKVAPIYVVSSGRRGSNNAIDIVKVKRFCTGILDQLEATAASRGRFSLSRWLS